MPEITNDKVVLELSRTEALVLFEWVWRCTSEDRLSIADQAEEKILWILCGRLEKILPEPFASNYLELLEAAREELRDKDDI